MKLTLSIILILTFAFVAFGQTIATTEDGRKVILKADKTWEYEKPQAIEAALNASDCSVHVETRTDRMTDRVSTAGKKSIIVSTDTKTGFLVNLIKSKDSIIFSIKAIEAGSGCVDDNAAINILFTDGSKLQLTNDGKFDCTGKAVVYFGGIFGKSEELNALSTKKIKAMRVSTMKSYVERDFTNAQATDFINQLNCLKP